MNRDDIAVIVLAAGRGKRMKSSDKNKVVLDVAGKPLILRSFENLKAQGFNNLLFVVGFAKESVKKVLGDKVKYVIQREQLGTGDAAKSALIFLPENIKKVIVIGGDDSAFYTDDILVKFLEAQSKRGYKMSVMTTKVNDSTGLGRIVRDPNHENHAVAIVEEKNATDEERKIKEINTGAYIFDRKFLEDNIGKIEKNEISGEYYLTDMLEITVSLGAPVFAFLVPNKYFHGVNTPEELQEANKKIKNQVQVTQSVF